MLQLATVTILPVLILAQFQTDYVIDDLHGCRVKYHEMENVIIFVCPFECYIADAPGGVPWYLILSSYEEFRTVSEEIYNQIQAHTGITSLTQAEFEEGYGSIRELLQCPEDITRVLYYYIF